MSLYQARILPAPSGCVGDEELLALCDLKVAHQLCPDNQEIARTYIQLTTAIEDHRKKEKELYKKEKSKKEKNEKGDKGDEIKKKEGKEGKEDKSEKSEKSEDSQDLIKPKISKTKNKKIGSDGKKLSGCGKSPAEPSSPENVLQGERNVFSSPGSPVVSRPNGGLLSEKHHHSDESITVGKLTKSDQLIEKSDKTDKTEKIEKTEKTEKVTTQVNLKSALFTIEEAMKRIGEVEIRAEELRKEGRHSDALMLTEKAKTAKLHIDSMQLQQARAEKMQRDYQRECLDGEETENDSGDYHGRNHVGENHRNNGNGGGNGKNKDLRLKGNLFAVDFLHPTPTIIDDARTQGLDLTDKRARRIMHELQKEASISKERALEWAKNGPPADNPSGTDDFVARVIDRVYREESIELAAKLVGGLSRGVLLGEW